MTKKEALEEMKSGKKVSHRCFTDGEYYELIYNEIIAEDKTTHTEVFWRDDEWRNNGWFLFVQ